MAARRKVLGNTESILIDFHIFKNLTYTNNRIFISLSFFPRCFSILLNVEDTVYWKLMWAS